MTVHQMQIFLATKKKKQLIGPVQSKVDFVCLWVSRGNDPPVPVAEGSSVLLLFIPLGLFISEKKQSMLIATLVFLDVWQTSRWRPWRGLLIIACEMLILWDFPPFSFWIIQGRWCQGKFLILYLLSEKYY